MLVQVAGDGCVARPVTRLALQPEWKWAPAGLRLLLEACVMAKPVYRRVLVQAMGYRRAGRLQQHCCKLMLSTVEAAASGPEAASRTIAYGRLLDRY